jgi:hypothetical protein
MRRVDKSIGRGALTSPPEHPMPLRLLAAALLLARPGTAPTIAPRGAGLAAV